MTSQTIRGKLAPRAIERMPQLFDNSLGTIASELLQNARRAGATSVWVITTNFLRGRTQITFRDNGHGIKDIGDLLTFGRSTWTTGVQDREDTAGMGSFCLATRGCVVSSLGQVAELTARAFMGYEPVIPRPCAVTKGTTISFEIDDEPLTKTASTAATETVETFTTALAKEALFGPLRVVLDGKTLPRCDFLEQLEPGPLVDGVQIGFHWSRSQPVDFSNEEARNGHMNFFGHIVATPIRMMAVDGDGTWDALWDVRSNTKLRMTLPTRNKVVQNAAWNDLLRATKHAAMRMMAARPSHRGHMVQIEAARMAGITIADPELALQRWYPEPLRLDLKGSWANSIIQQEQWPAPDPDDRDYDAAVPPPAGCVIVPELKLHGRHALLCAALRAPSPPALARARIGLQLHPGYEAMPRVTGIIIGTTDALGERTETRDFEDDRFCNVQRPNSSQRIEGASYDVTIEVTTNGVVTTWPTVGLPVVITSKKMIISKDRSTRNIEVFTGFDAEHRDTRLWVSANFALTAIHNAAAEITACTFVPDHQRSDLDGPSATAASWNNEIKAVLAVIPKGGKETERQTIADAMLDAAEAAGLLDAETKLATVVLTNGSEEGITVSVISTDAEKWTRQA